MARIIRVVTGNDFSVNNEPAVDTRPVETDEQIIERLRENFQLLEDMTYAVKQGKIRAMIVSGPPGVGKSFGVHKVLNNYEMLNALAGTSEVDVVKGHVSALHLYTKLYSCRDSRNILVFDDCDSVFSDEVSLNILKAALDSSEKRTICWNTDSRLLRNEDIPNSFEFSGGCVFITNIKFAHVRSKKMRDHLEALESRCHYLDLTIDTEREKMLRIKQIITDGMLSKYGFEDGVKDEIVNFVDFHKKELRELSLRMITKIADLRSAFPSRWESMAKATCIA